ncbi:MAG: sigma-70 family RNA polymerase sigma factor, partial [Bacilli bacterium]|nr:sigma-70 family RNA polymerase sigma factor [Bacilli bacterium]
MDEMKEEENLLVESDLSDKELVSQEKIDPMDEESLEAVEVEEVTDDDISDEKILDGMEDNAVLLDAVRQYLISIGKYRMLSGQEQLELAKRYREGDKEARELLIVHNLRLVVVIAKKMLRHVRRMELLDLIQEGNLGLMKAVDLFDPSLNFYFSTYAYRAIFTHIQRAINEKDNIMHTPEWVRITYHKFKEFRRKYIEEYGEEPPEEVVKSKYNLTDATYHALVNFENNVLNSRSLDEKLDDGNQESDSLENFIPDVEIGYDNLDDEVDKRIYMHILKEALSPYEYYIVYYRLLANEIKTLEQLSEKIGVSRESIRQFEKKAINKARAVLKSNR